ncbi:aspartate/glutamate racemase family protein [Bradyrhizobium sp. CCGUVB1N3]|uniref:maleate cis-trans isomerase family protein n=1 Tax=Bradyrhizobium sp. CCGUVB1N3 TaxID=2949629 RepID=UPI0020B18F7E|nr:aspartate/glutamate racemase family protein [Bradyrhizobium sp. CCGUVB1N3]MCP3473514.1 aspartate/glutamate racemase family protein [Bradyrhizobium sp. CCGUVB1N3]
MSSQQAKQDAKRWTDVRYDIDSGFGSRAHIGMVVIANDQSLSHEARAMLTVPGVALYESRIPASRERNQPVTLDGMTKQADNLDESLRLINTMRPSDVVALGCTSAAMAIGPKELARRIGNVHPGAKVTNPFTAILSALRALRSRRVGYVSPYSREVAERMIGEIEAAGFEVPTVSTFHNEDGCVADDAPFISPKSISGAVRQVAERADVDTIVIACTQMRAAAVIDELERQTGKSIISSNQALCWHALRLAECHDVLHGWGRLFEAQL